MRGGDHTTAQVAAYDRSFGRLCAGTTHAILDRTSDLMGPGRRVVDVGAGTGRLARALAELGATVAGVDADPAMVAHATAVSTDVRVAWSVARAQALPYAARSFDVVVANFLVNHVAAPRQVMRELQRVSSPTGRIVTTIWDGEPSPLRALWSEVVRISGASTPPTQHLPPEVDFERSLEGLAGLHQQAGGRVIHRDLLRWDWQVQTSDLWAAVEHGLAGIGRLYLDNPGETRATLRRAFDAVTSQMGDDSGRIAIPSHAPMVISAPQA